MSVAVPSLIILSDLNVKVNFWTPNSVSTFPDTSPVGPNSTVNQSSPIFSDTTTASDINGAAVCYVWIKLDPLRTPDPIADGRCTLTVMGILDNVPQKWENAFNVRYQTNFEIRKTLTNKSPIDKVIQFISVP